MDNAVKIWRLVSMKLNYDFAFGTVINNVLIAFLLEKMYLLKDYAD